MSTCLETKDCVVFPAQQKNYKLQNKETEFKDLLSHTYANIHANTPIMYSINDKKDNTRYSKKKHNVLCANCGGYGHIYKNCNHPIISYGVICYRLHHDEDNNKVYPKYLMVQRKDSLSYVEFIRGKYNVKNKQYLMDMFTLMTEDERCGIKKNSFENLWENMWCKSICDENKNFTKEYKDAYEKFEMLRKGYYLKINENLHFFDLNYILTNTISKYDETEWGFPKGRRNINEGDIHCALREFREETGIPCKSIQLSNNLKSLEEIFSGSNKIRYKHVYYIAKLVGDCIHYGCIDPKNKQQCKEIKNLQWYDYEEAQKKIRENNVERKELFKRLNQTIMKHIDA
jgi:8-oxo-dGTP pyrophosphatase MutT (NUDIX family)